MKSLQIPGLIEGYRGTEIRDYLQEITPETWARATAKREPKGQVRQVPDDGHALRRHVHPQVHPSVSRLEIHLLDEDLRCREQAMQVKYEVDDAEKCMAENAGSEEVHQAALVDEPALLPGREALVVSGTILLHQFSELIYRGLVGHVVRPNGRVLDVSEGRDRKAKGVPVGNVGRVQRLELIEAGKRALVVSPGELGFQVKLHLSSRVILQGVGQALSERKLPAGPEGVTVEEFLELVDGSELQARCKDGEKLLEKEAKEAAPLSQKQPPVLEGGWH
jgi:hypothetical protein